MRYVIILILTLFSSVCVFAKGHNEIPIFEIDYFKELGIDLNNQFIYYEIGSRNAVFIIVEKENDKYKVLSGVICDNEIGYDCRYDSECTKIDILDWAFNEMPQEYLNIECLENNRYSPFYFKFFLFNEDLKCVLSIDNTVEIRDSEFDFKLSQLKQLLLGNVISKIGTVYKVEQ